MYENTCGESTTHKPSKTHEPCTITRPQIALQSEDTGQYVGTVTLTLVAEAALRALPRPGPVPGSTALPLSAAYGRAPGVGAMMDQPYR